MEIAASSGTAAVDVTAFAVPDPVEALPELDPRLRGLVESGEITGEAGSTCVLHADRGRIVASGAGPRDQLDADSIRAAAAGVARLGLGGTVAWLLDDTFRLDAAAQARAAVDGLVLGGYDQGAWKTSPPRRRQVERVIFPDVGEEVVATAQRAELVARWTNRARDLANRPPNDLTPERLADRAAEIAQGSDALSYRSFDRGQIEAMGMGAFAAVARGSHNEPRLVVLRYEPPGARDDLVLGLVGKAVTFDTGGISLKPADYMEEMKGDMSGGAAVLEGTGAIAELGLPLRMIAVVGATENAIGGGAFRPGDILTAMNGKTIEITNTDAEGRLVLADALWYARQEGATHMVDFATLTGAMERALGDLYAGVFGNDDGWREQVVEAGEASGDHAWAMPIHRRFRRYHDSRFADLKNSSVRRQAIPAYAATFLEEFVGDGPWAHIDMAGPAFLRYSREDYLTQLGGTGYGVRLIAELAGRLAA
ncbi:MAG: leucyl aminopeptidase family protein [Verrucomicrobiota bacterium]